jgi:flavin reductase (DIM6/NTAB) family NADH-FMN oxidoreductase RutF
MLFTPAEMPHRDAYRLLIGGIMPRPIAWVSTLSADGVRNLAPFSFFTVICPEPMTICFAQSRRRDGGKKDTVRNVEETREFVVNIVGESLAEQMNLTAAELAPEDDEFLFAGLAAAPSATVRPPRVRDAKVAYECTLDQVVHVGGAKEGAGSLVIGTVLRIYVSDDVWTGSRIDTDALAPIGRCSGDEYTRTRDRFSMIRPGNPGGPPLPPPKATVGPNSPSR